MIVTSLRTCFLLFLLTRGGSAQEQDASPVPAASPTNAPGTAATSVPASGGWGGCVDPTTGFSPVTIGQPTTVCLVLSSTPDWATEMTYMRLNFQPIADEYSRFHVPQSFQQLVAEDGNALSSTFPGNITVHVESQTALSFQKRFYDGFEKVFPFLTAIINVDQGIVTGITWDNACLFCVSSQCEPNTFDFAGNLATESEALQPVGGCGIPTEDCKTLSTPDDGEPDACDLLLYVVWTGTDSQGRDFRSSAYRFSAFPAQSWTDRISQILPDFVPQTTEDLQELNPIK